VRQERFTLTAELKALVRLVAEADESIDDVVSRLLSSSALAYLVQLPPTEFERIVGRSLEAQGYEVEHVGGRGDEGIDLLATRNEETVAVQCKRYDTAPVTPNQVREFLGSMVAAKADRGIFVTTSLFTESARQFADGQLMELVDSAGLTAWLIQQCSRARWSCSKCGTVTAELTEWTRAWICSNCGEFNSVR
jgi:restriction system protein